MKLPEDDEAYLNGKSYRWELLPDPSGGLLVIRGFDLDSAKYDLTSCDLMIRIPAQYNIAALDMFYVAPPIRLKSGAFHDRADHMETHGGQQWQRFSRHLQEWRPGIDTIRTLLSFAERELKGRK